MRASRSPAFMAMRATRYPEAADPLTGSHDCSALALTARVRPARADAGTTAVADLVDGGRVGAFIVFVDEDGLRHAVRCQGAVLALSDADGAGSDTILQLTGNRVVRLTRPHARGARVVPVREGAHGRTDRHVRGDTHDG